ncbi:MAG TPA: hypothetical protein VH120_10815 [Gemmataceae bacterium]|jgi:hypothetical protein|nr:hypothetical protein [Gemmataceae bacterium]
MASVPFRFGVYGGLAECHGLLRPEGDCLVLEYQVQDNMIGVLRGKAKALRIPLAELEAVELRGRWFGKSLVIKSRSLLTLAKVPGSKQGRLELIVAKSDWPAAEQVVSGVYE